MLIFSNLRGFVVSILLRWLHLILEPMSSNFHSNGIYITNYVCVWVCVRSITIVMQSSKKKFGCHFICQISIQYDQYSDDDFLWVVNICAVNWIAKLPSCYWLFSIPSIDCVRVRVYLCVSMSAHLLKRYGFGFSTNATAHYNFFSNWFFTVDFCLPHFFVDPIVQLYDNNGVFYSLLSFIRLLKNFDGKWRRKIKRKIEKGCLALHISSEVYFFFSSVIVDADRDRDEDGHFNFSFYRTGKALFHISCRGHAFSTSPNSVFSMSEKERRKKRRIYWKLCSTTWNCSITTRWMVL